MARPSRETVYSRLEQAVADLEAVGGLPLPAEARAIWKDIWLEETHHSTAIEGNTLIQKEVQLLLFEGRATGAKELKEYLEAKGYADAAEWVYAQAVSQPHGDDSRNITLKELSEIHKLAVEPEWLHFPPAQMGAGEGPGRFRRSEVEPFSQGMKPPTWPEVQPRVSDWVDRINSPSAGQATHLMESVADLHAEFERIHPFRDGNGRVGRLATNLVLVRHGYPPAVIYKKDRDGYLSALRRADSGDPGSLGELFARALKLSIDRFLLPGLAGPKKLVPLSALVTDKFSHNALVLAAQRGRLQATQQHGQWYSTRDWVESYRKDRYKRT